jgi:hypothetical protein
VIIPTRIKIIQLISTWNAKLFNHELMPYHATGQAIRKAIAMSCEKSFDNSITISLTELPITLRIPISFFRSSAIKEANANRPRHATITASNENIPATLPSFSSSLYNLSSS